MVNVALAALRFSDIDLRCLVLMLEILSLKLEYCGVSKVISWRLNMHRTTGQRHCLYKGLMVMLSLPEDPNSEWQTPLILEIFFFHIICFIRGRLSFSSPS